MKIIICLFLGLMVQTAEAFFVPDDAYTFDFNVETFKMDRVNEEKILDSVELLRMVFSSPEFKQSILKHKLNGRYGFAHNKGLSNSKIYQRILEGMEKLHPYENNAMDVEVELYSDYDSQVIGFTKPSTKRIWMNNKFFDHHDPAEVASHLTHEWLHKLGFDHEKKRSETRKYSVPYAVGYIVKDIATRILNESYYQEGSQERSWSFRSRKIRARGTHRILPPYHYGHGSGELATRRLRL
jgi:hypothetical protein